MFLFLLVLHRSSSCYFLGSSSSAAEPARLSATPQPSSRSLKRSATSTGAEPSETRSSVGAAELEEMRLQMKMLEEKMKAKEMEAQEKLEKEIADRLKKEEEMRKKPKQTSVQVLMASETMEGDAVAEADGGGSVLGLAKIGDTPYRVLKRLGFQHGKEGAWYFMSISVFVYFFSPS